MTHSVDAKISFDSLAAWIEGEVHADPLRRAMLATDGSIFQKLPAAVVYPRSTADVQQVMGFAARNGLSVHARGAGSGLAGAALGDGIVIDFSKYMNRLLALDTHTGWFECQPGYRMGELEADLRGSGLFFPPDPSSGEYATFGGMCATNASGAHSVKYGNVADYLLDGEMVLADGTVQYLSTMAEQPLEDLPDAFRQLARLYQDHGAAIENAYPPIACNVAGYNLRGLVREGRLHLHRLLSGSEGTLGLTTRLRFRLIPKPAADSLVVVYCDDIISAARAAQLAMPLAPAGIEIMDKSLLGLARSSDALLRERIPTGIDNVLLIEFDGPSADACQAPAHTVQQQLQARGLCRQSHLAVSAREKEKFWALRKAAVPILYKLKGRKKILALVEDAAVPVDRLVPFFEGLYTIFNTHKVNFVLYGHIAKGLLHTRPLLDLKDPHDVGLLRILADAVFELVSGLDGTVSGEHGDGRLRSPYVKPRYPEIYPLFVRTKQLFDPDGILNPEIIIHEDPDQMGRHLRFGTAYRTSEMPGQHLQWTPAFNEEAEKCHGCSKCTTITDATRMCPIYKATRDESAAPKAKANVLRALISGLVDQRALFQSQFQKVMDQCVNCGSCYLECPSNVNIPKLVMEAKAQYVRRFGAPLCLQMTANVETAARLLRPVSALATPLSKIPVVRTAVARLTGLAAQRPMVTFARRSLYEQVPVVTPGQGPTVLYYAGCYAGFIRPHLGVAAVSVLSRMGLRIHLPRQSCCGLPHLSKGMSRPARRKVTDNLNSWGELLPEVDHVVVTCSSCGYALMQDWSYLMPQSAVDALQKKVIHISQLILDYRHRLPAGSLSLSMAYHQPCHLRLQPQAGSSLALLSGLAGARVNDLGSHCCGMAGSWGLIELNYRLSTTIATPMIAALKHSDAQVGLTDCPTCQMQMEHLGGVPIRHPVEMVWQSILSGPSHYSVKELQLVK